MALGEPAALLSETTTMGGPEAELSILQNSLGKNSPPRRSGREQN